MVDTRSFIKGSDVNTIGGRADEEGDEEEVSRSRSLSGSTAIVVSTFRPVGGMHPMVILNMSASYQS